MASGLCSRARAKPRSGSPESMTSCVASSSRCIRRRSASSSSTTIACSLLFTEPEVASDTLGYFAWAGCLLFSAIEHVADLLDKNFFREWLVQQVGSGLQDSMPCDKAVGIARHIEHLDSWLAR